MAEAVAGNVPAKIDDAADKKPLFGLVFLENLAAMSMLRQIGLLVGLAASVAIGFAVVLWSQQPDWRPLQANGFSEDCGIGGRHRVRAGPGASSPAPSRSA